MLGVVVDIVAAGKPTALELVADRARIVFGLPESGEFVVAQWELEETVSVVGFELGGTAGAWPQHGNIVVVESQQQGTAAA